MKAKMSAMETKNKMNNFAPMSKKNHTEQMRFCVDVKGSLEEIKSEVVKLFSQGVPVYSDLEGAINRVCRWRVESGRLTGIAWEDFRDFYLGGRASSTMASYESAFQFVMGHEEVIHVGVLLGGGGDGGVGGETGQGEAGGEHDGAVLGGGQLAL